MAAVPDLERPGETLDEAAPRLAAGIELIGLFQGSGYKEPPYLIRRADGQVLTREVPLPT